MSDSPSFTEQIRDLGVEGRHVLVHTSLRAIGGGVRAEDYIDGWREAVGESGLVMFPTLTVEPRMGPDTPPTFDVLETPPVRIGVTPLEAFQNRQGVRSLHATHSVVGFGRPAYSFLSSHFDSFTPCDRNSPYYKLTEVEGLIALVGCNHQSNTTLHMIEELAEAPYHLIPGEGTSTIIDAQGNTLSQLSRFHSWASRRDFMVIDRALTEAGIQTIHFLGNAEVRLVDAKRLTEFVVDLLQQDAYALVAK